MPRRDRGRAARRTLIVSLLLAAGCAAPGGPPAIATGATCAGCGMEVRDLRFACERRVQGRWRVYDAIECLMRDAVASPPGLADTWLADYDTRGLHASDSVWVVQGTFPSPMGGGLAAFRRRAAADSVADETEGRVDRLAAFMAGARRGAP